MHLIECKLCGKLYVRQTQNKLLYRLQQHLYHINKSTKVSALYDPFRTHGADDLIIAGLEGQPHWSAAQRVRAGRFWIAKLKTGIPNGLNEVV